MGTNVASNREKILRNISWEITHQKNLFAPYNFSISILISFRIIDHFINNMNSESVFRQTYYNPILLKTHIRLASLLIASRVFREIIMFDSNAIIPYFPALWSREPPYFAGAGAVILIKNGFSLAKIRDFLLIIIWS